MLKYLIYTLISLAAGIGIPIMAALNAGLGARIASPWAAAVVLFMVGLLSSTIILAWMGIPKMPTQLPPVHFMLAGVLTAFYILTVTAIMPRFGVSNVVFFVLLGQIFSATVIDHYGLFNTEPLPVSPIRLLGVLLMIGGIFLARKPV